MKKLTKKSITEKTTSTGAFGIYTCQLDLNMNYTVESNGKLFRNEGNHSFDTYKIIETKKEFINAIYELEND